MEFQDEQNDRANDRANNGPKDFGDCMCGCGLTLIRGHQMGFDMEIDGHNDVVVSEYKLEGDDWNYYISQPNIQYWGEFMGLIDYMYRYDPNNRVWLHLSIHLENRHLVPDDTQIQFLYMN
jgi:hypothetical protein